MSTLATKSGGSSLAANVVLTSTAFAPSREYWAARLARIDETSTLRFGEQLDAIAQYREVVVRWTPAVHDPVGSPPAGPAESRFAAVLAPLFALVHRYTGRPTVAVTVPSPGDPSRRERLYLVSDCAAETTFEELAGAAARSIAEALALAAFPVSALAAQTAVPEPRIVCTYEPLHGANRPPLREDDLVFAFADDDGGLALTIAFDAGSYGEAYVEQIAAHYRTLFEIAALAPRTPVRRARYAEARDAALAAGPSIGYGPDTTVAAVLERQLRAAAPRPAVVQGTTVLTFAQLDAASRAVAHRLLAAGVAKGELVAVAATPALQAIVGLVGVMRANAAFVPIGAGDAPGRVRSILAQTAARFVVGGGSPSADWGDATFIDVDACRSDDPWKIVLPRIQPSDPLYCVFTSGSTGTPKGVVVPHRAYANRLAWLVRRYGIGASDPTVHRTPLSFDVGLCEVLRALLTGNAVHVMEPGSELDVRALATLVAAARVTSLDPTPSFLEHVLDHADSGGAEDLASLRLFFTGVEAMPPALVRRFRASVFRRRGARLFNLWGATETTVDAAGYDCAAFAGGERVPIGSPMQNTTLSVRDADGEIMPTEVPGELCVTGDCLASGYLSADGVRRIVPLTGDLAYYRTGDTGRMLRDGTFEIRGRIDDQLKIDGHRVEPNEIEVRCAAQPGIREVAVVSEGGAQPRLCAYVVAGPEFGGAGALRTALLADLPAYMVPHRIVAVTEIPRTPHGKVDKERLRAFAAREAPKPPATPVEARLLELFMRVLAVDGLGTADDFFAAGGNSLKASRLLAAIEDELGVTLDFAAIFSERTVERLARTVASAAALDVLPLVPLPPAPHYALSRAQRRLWLAHIFQDMHDTYTVAGAYRLAGALDAGLLAASVAELVRRHEILRTTFTVVGDEPRQVVHPFSAAAFAVEVIDARNAPNPQEVVERAIAEAKSTVFDLERDTLLKVRLVELAAEERMLIFATHHILVDEWSVRTLLAELAETYGARRDGREPRLEPLAVQYKDYAAWHNELIASGRLNEQKAYWERRLRGASAPVQLPHDHTPPVRRSYLVDHVIVRIGEEATASMHELSGACGASTFVVALAFFEIFLHCLTGQRDMIVGTPFAGRSHAKLDRVVGFFINTLPLRTEIRREESVRDLVMRVREACVEALDAQDWPYEEVLAGSDAALTRRSAFDVVFEYNDYERIDSSACGFTIEPYDEAYRALMFDFLVIARQTGGALEIALHYPVELFERGTVQQLGAYLRTAFEECARSPHARIGDVDLIGASGAGEVHHMNGGGRARSAGALSADFDFSGAEG